MLDRNTNKHTRTRHDNQGNVRSDLFSAGQNPADTKRIAAWLDDRLHRNCGLFSEVVTVTPALAEYILSRCNKHNRALSESRATHYARLIKDGYWKLTSQGISLSRDGTLNNGQHRLSAVIRAGVPVQMYIAFGEDREAFDVLDAGDKRGGSDALSIAGYQNTVHLSSSARLLKAVLSDAWRHNRNYSASEILEFVQQHQSLTLAVHDASSVGKKFKCSVAAIAVAFYFILENSRKAERLPEFREYLSTGAGLGDQHPILKLRDGIMQHKLEDGIRSSFQRAAILAACTINAWNKFVTNRKGNIAYKHNDKFPEVV